MSEQRFQDFERWLDIRIEDSRKAIVRGPMLGDPELFEKQHEGRIAAYEGAKLAFRAFIREGQTLQEGHWSGYTGPVKG